MTDFLRVDGKNLDPEDAYRLVVGCVVPRPVAWITSIDKSGRVNAAPFSSYNYVATDPPILAVNIAVRDGKVKDTACNIRESGEFVVNVATVATLEKMHASAAEYPPDISEVEDLDLKLLPSTHVAAPRIACTPVQVECKLERIIPLGRGTNALYLGEVVAFHLSSDIFDGRRVDSASMQPIARLGGPFYAGLGEIFQRERVVYEPK